jgi:nucleoid-associated protein YgaU
VVRDVAADGPREVVVVRGDSLWSIAARHLPDGASDAQVADAVQRWYAANAEVVGDDPDLVRPGQVLVAPSS